MLTHIRRWFYQNPLDLLLSKACAERQRKFLIVWNRGLGDIPLGLYALIHRIRCSISDAEITFLTRSDLAEGFALLSDVAVLVAPTLQRGMAWNVTALLADMGCTTDEFDCVMERPDPTRWLSWQIGCLVPRLGWQASWDLLYTRFPALKAGVCLIGVHLQTETRYSYEKNWPMGHWRELFRRAIDVLGARIVLFGFQPIEDFSDPDIIDLRGKTTLLEMLSIIKNCCTHLIAPDSGVLSMAYYLDIRIPLKVISLWADPRQGILKQGVDSPNTDLLHFPLVGRWKQTSRIPVDAVLACLQTQRPGMQVF